jgi:hypothetical protein
MTIDVGTRQAIKEAFLRGQLRTYSVDTETGKVELRPVVAVLQHNTPHKPLIKVSLLNGACVTTTQDHSLFSFFEHTIKPVIVGTLNVGDALATVSNGVTKGEKVVEADPLPPDSYTYDLSVPGFENFVLSNGIVAHNSYSIGGVSLELEKASKYEAAYTASSEQFDKQLEKAKATCNWILGLQQSRYGTGIRSAFGPYTGRGTLSPRKFTGF